MKTYNIEITVEDPNNLTINEIKDLVKQTLLPILPVENVSVIGMRYVHDNEEHTQDELF